MILKEILSHVEILESHGDLNCNICGIDIDSRQSQKIIFLLLSRALKLMVTLLSKKQWSKVRAQW